MNQALKQRLVGALVLVALGVIFLPALFNGGRPEQAELLKEIPPAPQMSVLEFQEPVRGESFVQEAPRDVTQLYALEPKTAQGEKQIVENSPQQPKLDAKGLPAAWVLQVASFTDTKKADQLKKSLQAKNYKAFTRTITRDNKKIVRVMIGPEVDAKKLAVIKTAVDRDFKVKSIVVKFES
jgi:DedD protein